MIIILGGAIITIVWGLWRTINSKTSTQTQQGLGLGGILIGAAVAVTANLSDSDAGIMTAAALLAAAGMLVLAIFAIRAMKRPEGGGATSLDLAATLIGFFSFVVGSVYH
jgi:hypothetical protein